MAKRVHLRQLDKTDCAAACLAMVAWAHGRPTSITQLRDILGTGIKGTSLRGLLIGADALGFEAKAVRIRDGELKSTFSLPAIAHLNQPSGDTHFVVIHSKGRRRLRLSDPAENRPHRVTYGEFAKAFSGILVLATPTTEFDRSGNEKPSSFAFFMRLLSPQKSLFVWAIIASFIMTLLGISGSMITKVLFDEVVPYNLSNLLLPVFFLFGAIFVVQHLIEFVRQWIILHLSQRIDLPLILGYFRHVYDLPMAFFATRPVGDILTRFGDAMTIKNVLTGAALTVVMDVVMAILTGVVLFSLDRTLFLVVGIFILASLILIMVFRRPFRKVNEAQMAQASVLNSRIIDGLKGVDTIKLEANEKREMETLETEYVRSLRISFKEGMLANGQSTMTSFIQAAVSLVLIVLGASRILDGEMSLGTLMAFIALSAFFVDPVTRLIGLQLGWQEATVSLRRLSEILAYRTEGVESRIADVEERLDGSVEFRRVSFQYSLRDRTVIDTSFSIPSGASAAFVGPSGGGKSTIAKLILRAIDPDSGSIVLGGQDTREVDPQRIRATVAYVPQMVQLYSKSIADNVRMAKVGASDAEVRAALDSAGARDFVAGLPQRSNTVLEEAGAGLSGGERKRIGLARAMVKDAELFIFDEITSDLDALGERVIMNSIRERTKRHTAIFIAHRLSTVAHCDQIFVVDHGTIVQRGTHDELLSADGLYADMWAAQHEPDRSPQARVPADRKAARLQVSVAEGESTMRYV